MSYFTLLGSVMAVHLVSVMSPGPNFLVILQTSVSRSRSAGFMSAFGVALASTLWAIAAIFGIGVLFGSAAGRYGLVTLLGGATLVYLGVQSWRHADRPLAVEAAGTGRAGSSWRAFRLGLLTNLTNPKAVAYYGSVFTALLSPALPTWVRWAAVGVCFAVSLAWYTVVATLFSARRVQRAYVGAKRYIDRGVGGFLALLGLRLMFSSR